MNWHPIYLHWPDHTLEPWPNGYEYDYTDEFTEEDEREWQMNNGTVQLERQNENNKKYAAKAAFVVQGDSQFGATVTVLPGGAQAGASAAVSMTELGQIADQIDKVLGRKPREVKPAVSVKVEGDRLIVTGLSDLVPPF